MPPKKKGGGGGYKGEQKKKFFESVKDENVKTLRWSLRYGGFSATATEDENGRTALQWACSLNKIKSMQTILEYLTMSRQLDADEITNAQDEHGMTVVMMAAAKGNLAITKMLSFIPGTDFSIKDKRNMTALDYAKKNKKMKVAEWLMSDMTDAPESDDEEEYDDTPQEDKSKAGEKAVDLSRAKLSAMRAKGLVSKRDKEDDEAAGDERVWWIRNSCPQLRLYPAVVFGIVTGYLGPNHPTEPIWDGLQEALTGEQLDVHIRRQDEGPEEEKALIAQLEQKTDMAPGAYFNVDPALFHATKMRTLELRMAKGCLTHMPVSLGRLSQLLSLNLSHNSLTSLPDVFGRLRQLKSLDLNDNKLTMLPSSLSKCTKLEALFASQNELKEIAPLEAGTLVNLVTLRLDSNQLAMVHRMPFDTAAFGRLRTLSLAHNPLTFLPKSVGQLPALEELDCRDCQLEDLPSSLSQLSKKMKTMKLGGNPIKDRRLAKEVTKAEEGEARPLKQLLTYLTKHGDKLNQEMEKKQRAEDEKQAKAQAARLEEERKARAAARKASQTKKPAATKDSESDEDSSESDSSDSDGEHEEVGKKKPEQKKKVVKKEPKAQKKEEESSSSEEESSSDDEKEETVKPQKGAATKALKAQADVAKGKQTEKAAEQEKSEAKAKREDLANRELEMQKAKKQQQQEALKQSKGMGSKGKTIEQKKAEAMMRAKGRMPVSDPRAPVSDARVPVSASDPRAPVTVVQSKPIAPASDTKKEIDHEAVEKEEEAEEVADVADDLMDSLFGGNTIRDDRAEAKAKRIAEEEAKQKAAKGGKGFKPPPTVKPTQRKKGRGGRGGGNVDRGGRGGRGGYGGGGYGQGGAGGGGHGAGSSSSHAGAHGQSVGSATAGNSGPASAAGSGSSQPAEQGQRRGQDRDRSAGPRQTGICKFFQSPQGCGYGQTCRFRHVPATQGYQPGGLNSGYQTQGYPPGQHGYQGYNPMQGGGGHGGGGGDSRPICRFFMSPQGCRYGEECHFAHPAQP